MIGTVFDALRRIADLGGPVVLLLVGLSVVVSTVAVYKLWQFAAAGVGRHRALSRAIVAWDAGDRTEARAELDRSKSYLRPVIDMAISGHRAPWLPTSDASSVPGISPAESETVRLPHQGWAIRQNASRLAVS